MHEPNVLLVVPYHFFVGMAEVNNKSGPTGKVDTRSLTRSEPRINDTDRHLDGVLSTLTVRDIFSIHIPFIFILIFCY